jgi:hypothetical protein
MYPTAEVRWFYWGAAPRAVLDWLERGIGLPELQIPRRDHYLHLPGNASLGIKLREGRIEVKRRTQKRGTAHFGENVVGIIEHWRKWSFPISSIQASADAWLTPATAWIPVDKARRLRRYGLAPDGTLSQVSLERMPQKGCEFELSEVRTGGAGGGASAWKPLVRKRTLRIACTLWPPFSWHRAGLWRCTRNIPAVIPNGSTAYGTPASNEGLTHHRPPRSGRWQQRRTAARKGG